MAPTQFPSTIVKRDGTLSDFDQSKITAAIEKAGAATGEFGPDEAIILSGQACKVIAYRFNGAVKHSSCIGYRIMQLSAPYHRVYDLAPYLTLIVVGFSAYLLETRTFQMYQIRGYPYLIRPDASGIIQSPR
jgi:hypothetical protein